MTIATNGDDCSSANPQNQVVPKLLFKLLLLLLKLDPVGPDLAAHIAELGVAVHPTKATFKITERSVEKLMPDVLFHLHQLMLCLKALKASCTSLLGFSLAKSLGFLGFAFSS
jgi:hypothetical protein